MSYKSVYTWPNEAFPFRIYFESENLRIFIIENLQHNYNWLEVYKLKIKPTDVFFVILGSHWSEFLLKNANDMFDHLGLDRQQFYIFYNDSRDEKLFTNSGFKGDELNQNAWLDFKNPMNVMPETKKVYDSIYVGRLIPVKRHYLANNVSNLALVTGQLYGKNIEQEAPPHIYRNTTQLTPIEVCEKINQAHCGLILSDKEGACFASSEYLLCGIPVVSTPSEGGRAVWYDDYNSLISEPNEEALREAVEFFVSNPRDPKIIRERHITKANFYRAKFVLKLAELFVEYKVTAIDPQKYFEDNYFHKLRKSYKPNFQEIFK